MGDDPGGERYTPEAARAVWRRAAQLQAEAERRSDERRRLGSTRVIARDPEDFTPYEVRVAAIEAGISPEFVQIAMAEVAAADRHTLPLPLPWRESRIAHGLLGGGRASIERTRSVNGTLDAVTAAVLRVFTGHPCFIVPGEVADLPAAAGHVVVFNVPSYDWSATADPPFVEKASVIGLTQLHVTVRPTTGVEGRCEVELSANLQPGIRSRWRLGAATSIGSGAAGGALGIGLAAPALSGVILALPAVLGAAAAGGLMMIAWTAGYRYYLAGVEKALDESLRSLEASVRAVTLTGQVSTSSFRSLPPA
jgi:hypothetical protein